MSGREYENYKVELFRSDKRRASVVCLLCGIFLIGLALFQLPYRAENISELSGDSLKENKAYYFEEWEVLEARIDEEEEDAIYCIIRVYDKDNKPWLLCCDPQKNDFLADRIRMSVKMWNAQYMGTIKAFSIPLDYGPEMGGYFYLEEPEGDLERFYDTVKDNVAGQGEILDWKATYLCTSTGNYTLEAFTILEYARVSLPWGIVGLITSLYFAIKYRKRKPQQETDDMM